MLKSIKVLKDSLLSKILFFDAMLLKKRKNNQITGKIFEG